MSSVVISGNTSGSVSLVAPDVAGSSVQTLASVSGTLAPLVSGTAVTASGTAVNFTDIPSWAKRITVMFSGMSTNAANPFLIQIGSGSFNTTGYISGSAYSTSSGVSRITSTFGFAVAVNTAVSTISGATTITLLSGNTYVNSGVVNNDGGNTTNMCGGTVSLSGVLDRLRIIASSTGSPTDTFDAGTINIMYE